MKENTKELARGAAIAGLYALLSVLLAPFSYGLVQIRLSEALTILPRYSKTAIKGLFVGCLLANIIGVALGVSTLPDVALGSLATLIAAWLSYKLKNYRFLVPLPPVVINAAIVGWELCYVFRVGPPLWTCMIYVACGQLISCYVVGIPLSYALDMVAERVFGQ